MNQRRAWKHYEKGFSRRFENELRESVNRGGSHMKAS